MTGDRTPGRRPRWDPSQAAEFARTHYGLEGEADELPSERDQNFRLRCRGGETYLLRLSRSDESEAFLDFQARALEHLGARDRELCVPRILPASSGEERLSAPVAGPASAGEEACAVRLLSWLPGRPMAEVRPWTGPLLFELGQVLGRLDKALSDLEHPAANRTFDWDLRAGQEVVAERMDALHPAERDLVQPWLRRLDERAATLADLPLAIVHNDANEHNVLVTEELDRQRVAGLIDFGDMLRTWRISELAVACAYVMQRAEAPLQAAAHLVRGYQTRLAPSEEELDALFDLVGLRLCVSLAISAKNRIEQPDQEYLQVHATPTRALLTRLATVHPRFARGVLRRAAGLHACPRSRGVVRWLEANQGRAQGVLKRPVHDKEGEAGEVLDVRSAAVLDLSIGSLELGAGDPLAALEDRMRGLGPEAVAVGRYDEARAFYTSSVFSSGDSLESRTVHLGIDLFAPAGTTVCVPLNGVVCGVGDNRSPLDYGPTVLVRHEPEPGLRFYTLYGHLERASVRGLEPGAELAAGAPLARIGTVDENGGWPPHLHFQVMTDLLGASSDYPGVALPSEREVWLDFVPDPSPLLGLGAQARAPRPSQERLLEARAKHLSSALSLSYTKPLHIVRGAGARLFDDEGRAYLDAVNNVPHVGHSHPRVVRALAQQAGVLNTNTRYLHEQILRYSERLTGLLPEPLEVCFFVCSGSEANELALRLAEAATGGRDWLVLEGGYHGNTKSLVEMSPYKFEGPGGFSAPRHVHKVPLPDPYRGLHRGVTPASGRAYAEELAQVLAGLEREGRKPAGLLAEALPGCGGQIVPPPGFFAGAYEAVRAAGGVCIADEVQIGFGRVGTHFWAFETHAVVPDIVTLGKPIGNGHPLGAVVTTRAIAEAFDNGMEYFNTFGGNPVSCAVGQAVLDVIEDEGLQARAEAVGTRLLTGLGELATRHAAVGDVRGRGLFLGAELVRDRESRTPAPELAAWVVDRMKERGVLLSTDGPDHNVLKIKPPLAFGEAEADRLLRTLDEVLSASVVSASYSAAP